MKRNLKSDLTAIALAALLAMTPPVSARPIYDPTDPPDPTSPQSGHGIRIANSSPSYSVFDNTQTSVTINTPDTQTAGWFTDFFTGARDLGDWFCGYCSVDTAAAASSWTSFITSVVNPTLGSGPNGRWKLGDKIAVCDGSGTCVILTFHGYTTDAWFPDPRQGPVTKKDKGKYKNKTDTPPSAGASPNDRATPFFGATGQVIFWLLSSEPASGGGTLVVKVGPLEQVPADAPVPLPGINGTSDPGNFGGDGQGRFPGFDFGGGGWGGGGNAGGGGCVHVDSVLPDGRRAGDIRVGDVMMLGDEFTEDLATAWGEVSYSEEKTEEGFRITTSDGVSLVCSSSAPIWTDEGYVLAPHVLGKRVATRLDDEQGTKTNFKLVEQVEPVGLIQVQHITVGDRAFWAGQTQGAYILHHNEKYTGGSY